MAHKDLVSMTRDLVAYGLKDEMDYADEVVRIPASHYTDPERFELEKKQIFRRIPLMVAPSCELPEPADYKAMNICGVPLLLTRQRDGSVGAYLNMCTHRGNPVAQIGSGNASRFTCGYHGWTFKNDGSLMGVADGKDFGTVDKAALCLKQFPVYESAGMIWVILNHESKLSFENFLCGYDELLDEFGFKDWTLFSQRTFRGSNWKTAIDGYLDFYHLPVLHKDSFGTDIPNRGNFYAWGPHQRIATPSKFAYLEGSDEVMDLSAMSDEDLPNEGLMQGVWTVFPNISIASFFGGGQRGALISQILPGDEVGESYTTQFYVMENKPDSDEQVKAAHEQFDFLGMVVRDEDYALTMRQHDALKSGLLKEVLFGRNERGGQVFQHWADMLAHASDEELLEIFSTEHRQAAE